MSSGVLTGHVGRMDSDFFRTARSTSTGKAAMRSSAAPLASSADEAPYQRSEGGEICSARTWCQTVHNRPHLGAQTMTTAHTKRPLGQRALRGDARERASDDTRQPSTPFGPRRADGASEPSVAERER